MRHRPAVLAVVLLLPALPAVTWGAWAASATGTAVTGADVMSNAGSFTAACTARTASSSITLTWTASPDPYVTGYTVVRRSSNGAVVTINIAGRTTVTRTDTVSSPTGQTLTYTIQATTSTLWRTAATTASGRPSYTGSKNVCVTL